jgi:hypothetical protein
VEVEMAEFSGTEDDHISVIQLKDKPEFHKSQTPTFTVGNRNDNTRSLTFQS